MTVSRKGILWLLMTLLFMSIIFDSSNTPYQKQDIRPQLKSFIHMNEERMPHIEFRYGHSVVTWKKPYDMAEFFIRKTAHVVSYGFLCFLLIHTALHMGLNKRWILQASGWLSLVYASLDEWHQTFVQGRTGQAIDVAVDMIGVLLVISLYHLRWRKGFQHKT